MSHYHATWETAENLAEYKGIRKLDNYMRKVVEQDYYTRMNPNTTREDMEAMDLDRERERDAIAEYVIVERVIGHQDLDGVQQYMIKCSWSFPCLFIHFRVLTQRLQGNGFRTNIVPGKTRILFPKFPKNKSINIGIELALLRYQRSLKPILAPAEVIKSLTLSPITSRVANCEISR